MVLPVNVALCTVTGAFVKLDGTAASGTVTFTPCPARLLDATATPPTTILGTPIVDTLDVAGTFTVDLPATDDDDLNPTDWAYHVAVRLGDYAAYGFCMEAPTGAVDLADVTPIIGTVGDAIVAGPPGAPGPAGEGVPTGGVAGEVLAKASGADFDTDWVPASAPGVHASTHAAGSTDPVTLEQSQVTGLVAGLAAKQPLDADLTTIAALNPASDTILQRKVGMWVASTPTEYKEDLDLDAGDVGLGNVNNTSDAAKPVSTATQTALNLKANLSLLAGGTTGQVFAKNSATNYDVEWIDAPAGGGGTVFDDDSSGIVPASGGGTVNFLRADATWAAPPGAFSGVGNTATFSYNTTTTEPPTGNQLRLNSTTFSAATRLWVMQTTVDGLDVSIGLARIIAGHQIYFQDRDDASHWVKYNVTADGVDDGTYYDFTVAYHSGPGAIPAGQVELQAVAPGTVGVPPGGTTGQVLAKETGADYDLEWIDQTGGGGGISTEDAVDAVAAALVEGTGIDVTYNDAANTITVATTGMASTSDLTTHAADTTAVHGITDTSLLETTAGATAKVAAHEADTTAVHGITDTAALVTLTGTQTLTGKTIALGSNTVSGTIAEFNTAVTDANLVPEARTVSTTAPLSGGGALSGNLTLTVGAASETATGVVELATTAEATTGTDTTRAVTAAGVKAVGDTKQPLDTDLTTIAGLTATTDNIIQSVGSAWASRTPAQVKTALALDNVTNTTDANKPVSTAQQTALDLKQDKSQSINAQTGTTYTLVLADAGKIVTLSNAAAITLTVPTNASVAFPIGTSIDLIQLAAGQFTVTGAGPPTISRAMATAKSRAQYSVMTVIKIATDIWVLTGDAAAT